jgi:multiple sugar transport system ATP-binding protein
MRTELSKLHLKLGTTFIYVTHDQTEAMTMADRIVVMKDGFIQQCDTPQHLYDEPCNLFVAGFIGSPQMNFVEVKLTKRGEDVFVNFADFAVKVPKEKVETENYDKLMSYGGKMVIMGIRPEHIHDEDMYLERLPDSIITANVEVTELMGAETYLYLDVKDNKCTARVSPRTTAKPGDTIKIALDMSHIHLFDIDTEQTIIN